MEARNPIGDGIDGVEAIPASGVRLGGGRVERGVCVASIPGAASSIPNERAPNTIATTAKAASNPITPLRNVLISSDGFHPRADFRGAELR